MAQLYFVLMITSQMTPCNSILECARLLQNDDFGYSTLFISGGGDKNLHCLVFRFDAFELLLFLHFILLFKINLCLDLNAECSHTLKTWTKTLNNRNLTLSKAPPEARQSSLM